MGAYVFWAESKLSGVGSQTKPLNDDIDSHPKFHHQHIFQGTGDASEQFPPRDQSPKACKFESLLHCKCLEARP